MDAPDKNKNVKSFSEWLDLLSSGGKVVAAVVMAIILCATAYYQIFENKDRNEIQDTEVKYNFDRQDRIVSREKKARKNADDELMREIQEVRDEKNDLRDLHMKTREELMYLKGRFDQYRADRD